MPLAKRERLRWLKTLTSGVAQYGEWAPYKGAYNWLALVVLTAVFMCEEDIDTYSKLMESSPNIDVPY